MQTLISQDKNTSDLCSQKSSLIIDFPLGSGKFAVFHAYAPTLNIEYAVKAYPENNISACKLYKHEKKLLSLLQHPNIIQYVSKSKFIIDKSVCNVLGY